MVERIAAAAANEDSGRAGGKSASHTAVEGPLEGEEQNFRGDCAGDGAAVGAGAIMYEPAQYEDYQNDPDEQWREMPKVRSIGLVPMPGSQIAQQSTPPVSEGIAAGLQLSQLEQNAAWLDAYGMGAGEVERALGLTAGALASLRSKPQYREMVGRAVRLKALAVTEQAGSVDELFNGQIRASAAALIEVRDNPYAKESARIKAAAEFLDRASKAPKVRKEMDERRTVIVLPASDLRNMQQALLEEGTAEDIETLELLKGIDYVDESGKGERGEGENGQGAKAGVEVIEFD